MSFCEINNEGFITSTIDILKLSEKDVTLKEKSFEIKETVASKNKAKALKKIEKINDSAVKNNFSRPFSIVTKGKITEVHINAAPSFLKKLTQFANENEALSDYMESGQYAAMPSFVKLRPNAVRRPITDNVKEVLEYKENQKKDVVNRLRVIKRVLSKPLSEEEGIKLKLEKFKLDKKNIELDKTIEKINAGGLSMIFHAVDEELYNIQKTLNSPTSSSTERMAVKKSLDTLHTILRGRNIVGEEMDITPISSLDINDPYFLNLNAKLDQMMTLYESKVIIWAQQIVKDSAVCEILSEKDPKKTIDSMLQAGKDINWLNATFLGINNNTTKESLVPSAVYSILQENILSNRADLKEMTDRLVVLAEKRDYNLDFLKEFEDGVETGKMIGAFTPAWRSKLSKHLNNIRKIRNSHTKGSSKMAALQDVAWRRENTITLDPTLIPEIYEQYANIYPEYFSGVTEEQTRIYAEGFKKTMGPVYDEFVKEVVYKVKEYYSVLSSATDPSDLHTSNPFVVGQRMNATGNGLIPYQSEDGSVFYKEPIFTYSVSIPKKNKTIGYGIKEETGFYSGALNNLTEEELEIWRLMQEILKYASDVYDTKDIGNMSLPVFTKDMVESLADASGIEKLTSAGREIISEFKGWFYESGQKTDRKGLVKNYNSNLRSEIRELSSAYLAGSEENLIKDLKKEGLSHLIPLIKTSKKEDLNKVAYTLARKKVLSTKSSDILQSTLALANLASLQKARQDTLPVAELLLEAHKIQDPSRKRSIEKLSDYIDRVVVGNIEKYRGSEEKVLGASAENSRLKNLVVALSKMPLFKHLLTEKSLKRMSATEDKIYELLQDVKADDGKDFSFEVGGYKYRKFGDRYFYVKNKETTVINKDFYEKKKQEYIDTTLESLGEDLNVAGFIQGLLKLHIFKSLAFAPVSGIKNRIDGKNSALIMDASGQYWTRGNLHKANRMMAFASMKKLVGYTQKQKNGINQMAIFQSFLDNTQLIQDRKNELDRLKKDSKFKLKQKLNPFALGVDNPEFKNQGAVILSGLMDITIKDESGQEHPFINEQGEFTLYELVDGILKVKNGFRTEENVLNWENFEADKNINPNRLFSKTYLKLTQFVARSQGNYDEQDVIGATKTIYGRVAMIFKKYLPEQVAQRFSLGEGDDWSTKTGKKSEGRFLTTLKNNYTAYPAAAIAFGTIFGVGAPMAVGGVFITKVIAKKFFKDTYGKANLNAEAESIKDTAAFLKSFVIESLNYPLQMVNAGFTIKTDAFKNSQLTEEQIGNIRATTRDLAISMIWVNMLIAIGSALLPGDDEEETAEHKRFRYFVDNQTTSIIKSLSLYYGDFSTLWKDNTRLALVKDLDTVMSITDAILNENSKHDILENSLKFAPLPNTFINIASPTNGLLESEKEFSTTDWWDETIKGEEASAKKEYLLYRKELKEEGISPEDLEEISHIEGESYIDSLERIEEY